jgi:hypothetical protein
MTLYSGIAMTQTYLDAMEGNEPLNGVWELERADPAAAGQLPSVRHTTRPQFIQYASLMRNVLSGCSANRSSYVARHVRSR